MTPKVNPASRPRLARGCRIRETSCGEVSVLIPEGMIELRGSAAAVIRLLDGRSTLNEIVARLQVEHPRAPARRVSNDVIRFLELLHERRVVDL